MINLHEDYLSKVEFGQLREQVFFGGIPWYYNEHKVQAVEEDDFNNYQFTHVFYEMNSQKRLWTRSEKFPLMLPILSRLSLIGIYRIKANLEPLKVGLDVWHGEKGIVSNVVSDVDRYYSQFHTDNDSDSMTTGILYMNTCDGYTEFEDGSKVECRANRFITFPSSLKHRGVSQLDARFKCVINFNYFTSSK
tara:strand:- start:37 stop:612 length:576 start_codon:yes stop_codon:yes gene_type:complete